MDESSAASAEAQLVNRRGMYRSDLQDLWGKDVIEVRLAHLDFPVAVIPTAFLAGSGDGSWAYIYKVLEMVAGCGPEALLYRADGSVILRTEQAVPQAGRYELRSANGPSIEIARGPENPRSRYLGEPGLEAEESSSDPSTSSGTDWEYKSRLAIRDKGHCVLTSAYWDASADATHIVSETRPDVYEEIHGSTGLDRMRSASSGLTLRTDLRKAFERYEWSLYCHTDGCYYVHVFSWGIPQEFHGKRIDPAERFVIVRGAEDELPDRKLLAWHYKQCAQKYIRGYAWDMAVDARGGRA